MNGVDDIKDLGKFVEAGFLKLGEKMERLDSKLTEIERERAFESGFELKKKVEENAADIQELNDWKITTNTTVANSRRIIWGLISAVITLLVGLIVSGVVYWLNHLAK